MADFNRVWDRTVVPCAKYKNCAGGIIPMTLADMDFPVPEPVMDAMRKRMEHPFFGYEMAFLGPKKVMPGFYRRTFGAEVPGDWLVYILGVMPGMYIAAAVAGGRIMCCTPMYSNIRKVGQQTGFPMTEVAMRLTDGKYKFDFDAMECAVTPDLTTFILCNPQNPTGRIFSREELAGIVDFCERHQLLLISDEIHCEFAFDAPHIPVFAVAEGRNVKTVTLISPAKSCNIPKESFGFAIIPDEELRNRFNREVHGLFGGGSLLDGAAVTASYDGSCDEWRAELNAYLLENRSIAEKRLAEMPGIVPVHPEGTFLMWLDCSALGEENPAAWLEEHARVRLGRGSDYGEAWAAWCRMNFACPRSVLTEALDRMENALQQK